LKERHSTSLQRRCELVKTETGSRQQAQEPADSKTISGDVGPRRLPHRRTARPAFQTSAAVAEAPDATGGAAEAGIAVEAEVVGTAGAVVTIVTGTGGVAAVTAAVAAAAAVPVQDVTETEARTADTTTTGTGILVAVEATQKAEVKGKEAGRRPSTTCADEPASGSENEEAATDIASAITRS
jgi:hypothetical protein